MPFYLLATRPLATRPLVTRPLVTRLPVPRPLVARPLALSRTMTLDTILELLLGVSLSAAAGFRVFVPLLVLSGAAVMGHVDLPTQFDWVETPQALVVLAIAALLEIGGYFIPWFDHALDVVATPAAIAAGTFVTASLAPDMNPVAQWVLALAVGGGTAGITNALTNLLRLTSTGISGGLANPLLALGELAIATLLSLLAVTLPLVAGVLVLAFLVFALGKLWQFFKRKSSASPLNDQVMGSDS